jgi:hypothetical protein
MALINEGASFPAPMWAVVRFLRSAEGRYPAARAQALLCPPSLLPDEEARARDDTFGQAVKSLQDLGLVVADGDQLSLAPAARELSADDLAGFTGLLCQSVLAPEHNVGLAEGDGPAGSKDAGPRDLVRALAWFLTCDPFMALDLNEVTQRQKDAFPDHLGDPIVNNVRWDRFVYWASALGFAAQPLLLGEHSGQALVPDCTVAVRRAILATWEKGQRAAAADAVDGITAEVPVLPGGRYSRALGLPAPAADVSASLSFALLCGHDQGWLKLESRSDAAHDVFLADPDSASGRRRISEITITGSVHE